LLVTVNFPRAILQRLARILRFGYTATGRTMHALLSPFETHRADGRAGFSFCNVLGVVGAGFLSRVALPQRVLLQLSNPNIPKTNRLTSVSMRLQLNRRTLIFLVKRLPDIQGLSGQFEMVLHQHAIKNHRHIRRSL